MAGASGVDSAEFEPGERMLTIPALLRSGLGKTPDGASWLARLPGLVTSAAARWDLEVGAPYTQGRSSWCASARARSGPWAGREAVLKISYPHDEAAAEAAGLRLWQGRGSAALLDVDGWDLLLERCKPGTALSEDSRSVAERLTEAAMALRSLHEAGRGVADPGAAFPLMVDVCAGWARTLTERAAAVRYSSAPVPLDDGLVRVAAEFLSRPPRATAVVVHGDANPGNLLRVGNRWGWIDPKPMIGDPAYDPWPLLEQIGDPFVQGGAVLTERTALVADVLGLDAARIAAWAMARSVESALWAWAELSDIPGALTYLDRAKAWAGLMG